MLGRHKRLLLLTAVVLLAIASTLVTTPAVAQCCGYGYGGDGWYGGCAYPGFSYGWGSYYPSYGHGALYGSYGWGGHHAYYGGGLGHLGGVYYGGGYGGGYGCGCY